MEMMEFVWDVARSRGVGHSADKGCRGGTGDEAIEGPEEAENTQI